jgi:uncharacterized protein YecE (DUF72 family)
MKASERIAYYAQRLPVVELDSTYRFPPTPQLSHQLVDRTPDGFTIDVQAWALLGGNAALPDSLWEDLRAEVRPEVQDRRRLYIQHLSPGGRREAWDRFAHAIQPLHDAGRLGAVILRYPHWLKPGGTGRALMLEARRMLPEHRLVVELRNHHWLTGGHCESTLSFLEDHDLGFLCVDQAGGPGAMATTSELAVLRLHGRNPGDWEDPEMELAERFAYQYSAEELGSLAPLVRQLAETAEEVHVLFANTYRDYAVNNAIAMAHLLPGREVPCTG